MTNRNRPHGRLPAGITRGLWDYVHSEAIANDYDDYFAFNRLFNFDEDVVMKYLNSHGLEPRSTIADLGCGTGRALVRLAEGGYRGLAVDLSSEMLNIVRAKAKASRLNIDCLKANLVELDGIAPNSLDGAVSLFSTLGMIRGRNFRQVALGHVGRILRPNSPFVIHVHNYWFNLFDPYGPWWLAGNLLRAIVIRDIEAGDKFFHYRNVPNMFLHVYRRGEILADLRKAGFIVDQVIPLDTRRHQALRVAWLLSNLRANGWIILCREGSTRSVSSTADSMTTANR